MSAARSRTLRRGRAPSSRSSTLCATEAQPRLRRPEAVATDPPPCSPWQAFPQSANEPPKLLRGFEKLQLAGGGSKQVTFPLSARDRSVWDGAGGGGWKEVKGSFGVVVGASSRDLKLHGNFTIA